MYGLAGIKRSVGMKVFLQIMDYDEMQSYLNLFCCYNVLILRLG